MKLNNTAELLTVPKPKRPRTGIVQTNSVESARFLFQLSDVDLHGSTH